LGDLSRYKELHLVVEGRTPDWYVAANYYRQASALWPAGGNPHNQVLVPTQVVFVLSDSMNFSVGTQAFRFVI